MLEWERTPVTTNVVIKVARRVERVRNRELSLSERTPIALKAARVTVAHLNTLMWRLTDMLSEH